MEAMLLLVCHSVAVVVLFALDRRSSVESLCMPRILSIFFPDKSCFNRKISLLATSSANLKESNKRVVTGNRTFLSSFNDDDLVHRKRKYSSGNVVSRLKQAAMQTAAAIATEQLQESIQMKNTFFSNRSALSAKVEMMNSEQSKVGTLRELTFEIDLQLNRARALPWGQYQTHMMYHSQLPRFQKQHHHVSVLPRDSMAAIITHNNENEVTSNGLQFYASTITHQPNINMTTTTSQLMKSAILTTTLRHVAIILTKRSMLLNGNHMLTLECAGRIQRLVYAMKYKNYKPSVIVVLGDHHTSVKNITGHGDYQSRSTSTAIGDDRSRSISTTIGDDKSSSDADVGYAYLIHLLTLSNDESPILDLSNIRFHLERSSLSAKAFENITSFIQQEFVPQWLDEATLEAKSQEKFDEPVASLPRSKHPQQQAHRRWKLHVQFALLSSDYHLCNLHDIHVRSPGQSFIRALDRWSFSSLMKNSSSDRFQPSKDYPGLQLESSWIYLYSTIANIRRFNSPFEKAINEMESDFKLSAFTASCYQRAQELMPVLQNLRGVVDNAEFFQRDNYRVLVHARRCLVSGMEQLYQQQPSLSLVHKVQSSLTSSHNVPKLTSCIQPYDGHSANSQNGIPLDVVLEGALLSLGRCVDLVRPAGLLTGSVLAHDFKLALMILDRAVSQISTACDPDQPLNFTIIK
jgi:hypothetical protein